VNLLHFISTNSNSQFSSESYDAELMPIAISSDSSLKFLEECDNIDKLTINLISSPTSLMLTDDNSSLLFLCF
jgi:hypothetical protein